MYCTASTYWYLYMVQNKVSAYQPLKRTRVIDWRHESYIRATEKEHASALNASNQSYDYNIKKKGIRIYLYVCILR
jgi:hypothetical protein